MTYNIRFEGIPCVNVTDDTSRKMSGTNIMKRRPNWTKDECLLLADLVKAKKTVLEGKFGPGITSAKRQEAWQKVTEDLNASSSTTRSKEEVEKKWKNLKAQGGGPPPQSLSPVTNAVVDVVGRDNVTLTGITEGCDSTLFQFHFMDDDNLSPTLTPTMSLGDPATVSDTMSLSQPLAPMQSISSPASVPVSVPASVRLPRKPSYTQYSPETEALMKEKLKLEIQCLKIRNRYFKLKCSKLEE